MSDTTDTGDSTPAGSIHDGHGTYDVVLLVEQALSAADAQQVRSLHAEIEDPVVYHVLLPLEDAAARVEASLGTLGAGDLMLWPEPNDFTRADIIAGLEYLKPVTSFRSGYAYDNLLYVVAGEVAAAAGGASRARIVSASRADRRTRPA